MRLWPWLIMVALGCGSCCPTASSPPNLPFDAANGIELNEDALTINGEVFHQPPTIGEMEQVLGPADRVHNLVNDIYVWDDHGVYAYVNPGEELVDDISISFAAQDYEFIPAQPYPHNVRIADVVVGKSSSLEELMRRRFERDEYADFGCTREVGGATVYVQHGEDGRGLVDVSLSIVDW